MELNLEEIRYKVARGEQFGCSVVDRMLSEINRLEGRVRGEERDKLQYEKGCTERLAKIKRLAACNAELVGMIKALIEKEWIEDQEYGDFCPFCEGQKPVEITSKMDKKSRDIISEFNKTAGHSPSCIRQRAIALIGENK